MKEKLICRICKKNFYVKPSRLKRAKFCSVKCKNKSDSIRMRINNPMFNDDILKWKRYKDSLQRTRTKKTCIICKKEFFAIPSRIKIGKGKYCSRECYAISKKINVKRELNSNWRGGLSRIPYPIKFDTELKEQIRKRDNYICQLCGCTEEEHIILYGAVLCVHHIDYKKDNCHPKNLNTLCKQCNARVNFNRKYWEEYFNERSSINTKV